MDGVTETACGSNSATNWEGPSIKLLECSALLICSQWTISVQGSLLLSGRLKLPDFREKQFLKGWVQGAGAQGRIRQGWSPSFFIKFGNGLRVAVFAISRLK